MQPAVPLPACTKQIRFPVFLFGQDLSQRYSNGHRVVQDAKRIHVAPELIFNQQFAYVLSKAGAKKCNPLRMTDIYPLFRELNLRSEIHFPNYLLKFKGKNKHNTYKCLIFA